MYAKGFDVMDVIEKIDTNGDRRAKGGPVERPGAGSSKRRPRSGSPGWSVRRVGRATRRPPTWKSMVNGRTWSRSL